MKLNVGARSFIPQRVFCIGQNYLKHIREMKGEVPEKPVIFCKPTTSLVPSGQKVNFPRHGEVLHHEAEVVVLIGKEGWAETVEQAGLFIAGLTLGLDLTLRDLQKDLRDRGLPRDVAKGFEQSAPIGGFVAPDRLPDLADIEFGCTVNNKIRQYANTNDMIFPIERLIVEVSKIWKLLPGDLVFTGTPSGVGPLKAGDRIKVESPSLGSFSWEIV